MKMTSYLKRLNECWQKIRRGRAENFYRKVAGRMKEAGNVFKKWIRRAAACKETIGYYAVLAIVLVALSAAAYDYRGKKSERTLLDSNVMPDPGVEAQMQTDPTFSPEIESAEFILPVAGELLREFTDDTLIWSTSLQLWKTHPALDIAANVGEAVVATADGEIIEAYSDALYGNTIVIDHGKGRRIKYASLNTLEMANVGERVRQGDVIGSVGSCIAESEQGAHIHLEYTVNDKPEDFSFLLSESELETLRD